MKEYECFLVDDDLCVYNKYTNRKLKPFLGTDGYYQVVAHLPNGRRYHKRLHIIIANCFIPNPQNYKYVNHIDSDKTNNRINNLEWCTNSYNVTHGWHSGNRTHKNNTQISAYKLDELIGEYKSIRECARELNLDRHKIARILKGELPTDYMQYRFEYTAKSL